MGKGCGIKSKAEARAMYAAKEGKSTLGIPKSVGEKMTNKLAPGSEKRMPARKGK